VKAVSVEDVEIVALLHFSISERQCRNSVGCLNDGAKDGGENQMLTFWLESLFDFQWRKSRKLFCTRPLGFLMDTGKFRVRLNRVKRFDLKRNRQDRRRQSPWLLSATGCHDRGSVIAEVGDLRGERANLDRKGG
jgi:hypothetical protein